jgi:hypothetical protein
MKDEFRYLRFARHRIYQVLSLINRVIWMFFSVEEESTQLPPQYTNRPYGSKGVLVFRDFNGSNMHALENLRLNLSSVLEARGMSLQTKVREGNVFLGNTAWLYKQMIEIMPKILFIADPQLIGLPGPIGMFQCLKLAKRAKRMDCQLVLILFDLPDPQGSLFGSILSRLGTRVVSICNSPSECQQFSNIRNAVGPAGEICHQLETSMPIRKLNERKIDLHLPRPSYSPRKELVEKMIPILKEKGLKVSVGGTHKNYSDYVDELFNTKIVVVTNSLISGCVGKWPLPDGPKSHVVSYNYEALRAGALLMSEETLPLNDVFIDGLEYLSFKNYNDLVEKITFFLQNEVLAEQIASAGNRKYIELIEKQAILNSVIDRM